MSLCQWVKADGKVCGAKCESTFCFSHAPLAMIGYTRNAPKIKPFVVATKPPTTFHPLDSNLDATQDTAMVGGNHADGRNHDDMEEQRRKWKAELDQDFEDKRGGIEYLATDFPQLINGLYFQTIDEFADYCEGGNTVKQSKKKKKGHHYDYTKTTGFGGYNAVTEPYVEKVTKQDERLKRGWFQRIDAILHMRYIIFRDNDGWYYAIFASIHAQDKKDEALKEIMRKVAETQLPTPKPVTIDGVGSFHSSRPFYTFQGADGKFSSGGESLSRIRERIRKANDPKYIPPNLRKMAIAATYNEGIWALIPQMEHERLKKWLADDCPGWYGNPPKGGYKTKSTNWNNNSSQTSLSLTPTTIPPKPPTASQKDVKNNNAVWSYKLKKWVKRDY